MALLETVDDKGIQRVDTYLKIYGFNLIEKLPFIGDDGVRVIYTPKKYRLDVAVIRYDSSSKNHELERFVKSFDIENLKLINFIDIYKMVKQLFKNSKNSEENE